MPTQPSGLERLGRFAEPSLYILLALSEGPKHGYAIMQDVAAASGSKPGPGTLYGALARLERRGLIEQLDPVDRRRPYRLTARGSAALQAQLDRLAELEPPAWPASDLEASDGEPVVSAGGPPARESLPIEPLAEPALRALRTGVTQGLSRRTLLRRSLGAGIALWVAEVAGGSISFLWSAATAATPRVRVGTLPEVIAANPGLPIDRGFPAYVPDARAFVILVDPATQGFLPGEDPEGDGRSLNVRALSQRCPHLGCRPNPCVEDFWFHCPCHKSRYDRLGTKAAGVAFGPAARSMDRYAIAVSQSGVLTIDTGHITLGPLPIALGQPGLIPPLKIDACG